MFSSTHISNLFPHLPPPSFHLSSPPLHCPDLLLDKFLPPNSPVTGEAQTAKQENGELNILDPHKAAKKKRGDRHSKICTAHGTRDRRVRLSIEISRKFFDLQDMLGFDKASKTVDWLLTKSRTAIKEVMEAKSLSNSNSECLSEEAGESEGLQGKPVTSPSEDKTVNQQVRESRARARARARARERTREKMCTRSGLNNPKELPDSSISRKTKMKQSSNFKNANSHSPKYIPKSWDNAGGVMGPSHMSNMNTLPEFQIGTNPWEVCNNHT